MGHPETADVPMALTVVAGAITHRLFVEMQPITPEFLERLVRLVCAGLGVVADAGMMDHHELQAMIQGGSGGINGTTHFG